MNGDFLECDKCGRKTKYNEGTTIYLYSDGVLNSKEVLLCETCQIDVYKYIKEDD